MMFWTRLGSSVVLVVLALIFLISGGPVLGAVCLLLSLTAYCELIIHSFPTRRSSDLDRKSVV